MWGNMQTIVKVLNSSVVLVEDEQGNSSIVMGKGIGFGRKKDEILTESYGNQTFIPMKSERQQELFQACAKIPEKIFEISESIIQYAESQLGIQLNSSLHYVLADHVSFVIERYEKNIQIVNRMLYEVKSFYPKEYRIGDYGRKLINQEYCFDIEEDEAANIAFHIINANDTENNNIDSMKNVKLIREITDIIQYSLNRMIDKDSMNYARFVTHIKFFVLRLLSDSLLIENNSLYEEIRRDYPESIRIANKVASYLSTKYGYVITKDERVYLAIHINRI